MRELKAELHRLRRELLTAPAVQLALFDATGELTALRVQGRWLQGRIARQTLEEARCERTPCKTLIGIQPDDF